jgi:hypothetical protein
MTTQRLQTDDYYSTSDLNLACVISLYFPLWVVDRTIPSKAEFIFKREEGLDKLVESFWRREIRIEPQAYFNQLRILKARLHGEE